MRGMRRMFFGRIPTLVVSVSVSLSFLAALFWSNGSWASVREDALEKKYEILDWELQSLERQTREMASSLSSLQVRLIRLKMALQAEASQSQEPQEKEELSVFQWEGVETDLLDALEDEETVTEIFATVASTFENPNMTHTEVMDLAAQARPIIKAIAESETESRWKDEALYAQVFEARWGHERDYAAALGYLEKLWEIRDRVHIEEELRSLPIYEAISFVQMERAMLADGMDLNQFDPVSIMIKMDMIDVYKQMGRVEEAEKMLLEVYELAGKPKAGHVFDRFRYLLEYLEIEPDILR